MSAETNKEILRRGYEELFNNGNLQAAGELFGEDFYNHAGFPGWPRGPEHIRRAVTMLRTAFPDLHYTLEDVIAEGDTVAARWTSATSRAPTPANPSRSPWRSAPTRPPSWAP